MYCQFCEKCGAPVFGHCTLVIGEEDSSRQQSTLLCDHCVSELVSSGGMWGDQAAVLHIA